MAKLDEKLSEELFREVEPTRAKPMGFTRSWDSSCPRVWDSWEADGKKWIIQDLPPEDDEEALQMLLNHFCRDEVLCAYSNIVDDVESMRGMAALWRKCLAARTALACYVEENGHRQLASVNVCIVSCKGEEPNDEIIGESWKNFHDVLFYLEKRADKFEYLGLNQVLSALGLLVAKEFRGARLGARMLAAREPLCQYLGIKGTATEFTGPASQKSAERAGFETIATINMKELAEAGLKYPKDESKVIKLMVKKYDQ